MPPYAIIPMPLYTNNQTWVKIIVPLEVFDIVERAEWCWDAEKNDAFPLGDSSHDETNSFRILAQLFNTDYDFENATTIDLRPMICT